ncbi:Uncharacterised protein [Listeria monocytogenes]|nr:Uncharacterised protein [Listeria monocytogenes]
MKFGKKLGFLALLMSIVLILGQLTIPTLLR